MTDDREQPAPAPPRPAPAGHEHEPADRDDREVPLDDPELTELPLEEDGA